MQCTLGLDMDSSLSLSSWYTGIHCYALYQSWWQKIQSSCHFSFFQAVKSGNNGLGSVIESSGSQLIEVVSWSMICFPSQLFKSLGDWLTLTLDILKRKVYNTAPLVKNPRLLSWPELVWKNSMEMENNRFEREWVSTQRSRVRRLTGRRGYGHHWSGYESVFFLAIYSLSVLWLTLQTRHHTSFTDHDSSIWRLFIRWWFWGSQLSSDSLLRQKAICTVAHVNNYLLWSLLVENAKPFMLLASSVFIYNNVSSSLPLPSSIAWLTDLSWLNIKVTAIQLPEE